MAVTDFLEARLPGWMLDEARIHWLKLNAAVAAVHDAIIEALIEGRLAGMPGQNEANPDTFTSYDALPYLDRDLRIRRGPAETHAGHAERLRRSLEAHALEGTAFELLAQIRGIMGPNPPRVRVVSSAGIWQTIEADGTLKYHRADGPGFQIAPDGTKTVITTEAHPWDWGGTCEAFVIIYAPTNAPLDGDEGKWGDGTAFWGQPGTVGTSATLAFVELVRGLVREWTTAGISIPWIIIAFDEASFDPETPGPYPAAGMPDGQWEDPWKDDGGTYVKSRLETARYWRGPA